MQYTKEHFHKTIGILVQAYISDNLIHGECKYCAVGNLVSCNDEAYDFYKHGMSWYKASGLNRLDSIPVEPNHPDIVKTGYNVVDLLKIEHAFELAGIDFDNEDDPIFHSLMAVVDVLCDIHGMNETEKQESKALFVKA